MPSTVSFHSLILTSASSYFSTSYSTTSYYLSFIFPSLFPSFHTSPTSSFPPNRPILSPSLPPLTLNFSLFLTPYTPVPTTTRPLLSFLPISLSNLPSPPGFSAPLLCPLASLNAPPSSGRLQVCEV